MLCHLTPVLSRSPVFCRWFISEAEDHIKALIFGGLDGVSTTFAILAAGHGGGLLKPFIVLMGCAQLVADGIAMGLGVSTTSSSSRSSTDDVSGGGGHG